MITIEKYFEEKTNKILEQSNKDEIYFFKGFAKKQIMQLIRHQNRILNSDDIIDEFENIDILVLNDKWLDIIQNIKLSDKVLVGFYEELVAIRDFLPRVQDKKIVIVENNMFLSWQPCIINKQKASDLLCFFQEENAPSNDELSILSQYYGDVRILSKDNFLTLPVTIDNEDIRHAPFWLECDVTNKSTFETNFKKINANTDEDFLYRTAVLDGSREAIAYISEEKRGQIKDYFMHWKI